MGVGRRYDALLYAYFVYKTLLRRSPEVIRVQGPCPVCRELMVE